MASNAFAVEQGHPVSAFRAPSAAGHYSRLFAAIGRSDLQHELLTLFNQVCGADSVHLFWLERGRPDIACGLSLGGDGAAQNQAQHYMDGGFWRHDRQMGDGSTIQREQPIFYRMDTRDAPSSDLRNFYRSQRLIERLMICGWTPVGVVGFSVMRATSREMTPTDNLQQIGGAFADIFPLVAKHLEMVGQSRRLVESLTTLPLIEQYLGHNEAGLSQREMQVAARLLYGLSASCIASDLGIGTETVNTHRKRLYDRLGISCHHELLLWYLKHYGRAAEAFGIPYIAAS